MATTKYSSKEDLLTGNIPAPTHLDPEKFIQDAADEIDSSVGFVYKTPLDMSEESEMVRPARLLIKRVSNYLATGRLIHASAAGQQDDSTHAYANRLIGEALGVLRGISNGSIILEGAELINPDAGDPTPRPLVLNGDEVSGVDAFYDFTSQPSPLVW